MNFTLDAHTQAQRDEFDFGSLHDARRRIPATIFHFSPLNFPLNSTHYTQSSAFYVILSLYLLPNNLFRYKKYLSQLLGTIFTNFMKWKTEWENSFPPTHRRTYTCTLSTALFLMRWGKIWSIFINIHVHVPVAHAHCACTFSRSIESACRCRGKERETSTAGMFA